MKNLIMLLPLLFAFSASAVQLFVETDRSLPLVHIGVAIKGGSIYDPDQRSGTMSLLFEMLQRGTQNKTKAQLDSALDQLGASLSIDVKREVSSLQGTVLEKNLPGFLDLLAEIISSPSLRQDELNRLRKEMISALEEELANDRAVAATRFGQIFLAGHPYSKRPEGKIRDLKRVTLGDLRNVYNDAVLSSNMIILAAGAVTEKDLLPFKTRLDSARPGVAKKIQVPEIQGPSKMRVVLFDKPERTQTQVVIGQKGLRITDPRYDAFGIGNEVFGGGSFGSRMFVELRVKRGWTYNARSSMRAGSQPLYWAMGFFPKNEDTPAAIAYSLKMLKDWKKNGITEKEFEFTRSSQMKSASFNTNTPKKRLENRLIEVLYSLPQGYFANEAERLEELELEEVNSAISSTLQGDGLLIGVLATASISRDAIAKELGIAPSAIEVIDYRTE
jgi:zinc protease